jgi:putative endonuclease
MTDTTAIGRAAETAAAQYLEAQGFTVLDRNWRNRWCELDIVARRTGTTHFVEVKYRRHTYHGAGYESVGYDKTNRLRRAALAWCQAHRYDGDYQIDIISMSGPQDQPIIEYLPNVL